MSLDQTTERKLDELAILFHKHDVLNRKGVNFFQFVEHYWRKDKLEEVLN